MISLQSPLAYFPRGLAQPDQGYRFSQDSLLLGAFMRPAKASRVIDLGCGCGVAGFALALANQDRPIKLAGLEIDPESALCAAQNAIKLGLDCQVIQGDLKQVRDMPELTAESFNLVLANPPYRQPGRGRMCQNSNLNQARFESSAKLDDFAAAAGYLLQNRGKFGLVYPADQLCQAIAVLHERRLEPKRLLPLCGKPGVRVGLVLLEAVKNAQVGLKFAAPLVLYEGSGAQSRLTRAALEFCPFLACNPGQPSED